MTAQKADVRIGDTEREQAVSALGEHYLAGRLTKEEYDERTAAAWTAKTASTLSPLFGDLPPLHQQVTPVASKAGKPAASASRRRRGRFPLFPMLVLFVMLLVLTPLHMPWWAWLIFAWLWMSGGFAAMSRRWHRSHWRH